MLHELNTIGFAELAKIGKKHRRLAKQKILLHCCEC
jgi:hypothetical protein